MIYNNNAIEQTTHYYPFGLARFTTMDPMAEKYYHLSPYAYCANNPVNAVDPTGMDWVSTTIDGNTEYYYDREVTSQADIERIYGKNSGVSHIKNGTTIQVGGCDITFMNDAKENKYGYAKMNGNRMDNSQIYYGDDYTIFGTTDESVDAKTLHKNYMGTSYTGPNNPVDYNKNESYQYIPKNPSEYGSYIHDILYEQAGAKGAYGAFLNTNPLVVKADKFLVDYNCLNIINSNTPILDKGRSALTALLFAFIVEYKTLYNNIKK